MKQPKNEIEKSIINVLKGALPALSEKRANIILKEHPKILTHIEQLVNNEKISRDSGKTRNRRKSK